MPPTRISPGVGRLLEPGRHVHRVAADGVVALLRPARAAHDLAGVDADPDLQPAVQPTDRGPDLERAAQGALGVVVVRLGCAEDRHGRIADVLLERAAESDDLGRDGGEVGALDLTHRLRIGLLGAPGESNEVREQDRHQAPLVGDRHFRRIVGAP